ncbi:hypothetical protein Ae201684P_016746 [Aphanomyces euteiches]|nr:hypothetical protein Ae201684P_016746 [Aphanomyces euteiches]
MNRVNDLYEEAFQAAEAGIAAEEKNEVDVAIQSFEIAVRIFSRLAIVESLSKRTLLEEQIADFRQRIAKLQERDAPTVDASETNVPPIAQSRSVEPGGDTRVQAAERLEQEAQALVDQGFTMKSFVVEKYMLAADEYMKILKDASLTDDFRQRIRSKVEDIIEKVMFLKEEQERENELDQLMEEELYDESEKIILRERETICQPVQRQSTVRENPNRMNKLPDQDDSVVGKYTTEELDVLRNSSVINGRLFQPWLSSDIHERFDSTEQYVDQDGFLTMSPKQMEKLDRWVRPTAYGSGQPQMVSRISPYVIVQDVVTDCSFVASLCITAAYEMRFHKQLITKIIYPQDANGRPIVNPGGKSLWTIFYRWDIQGLSCVLARRHQTNYGIIEKAYLKVNGGYDFPGSNSGIDLFALTGWIPESISFMEQDTTNGDIIWQRLISAHNFGDCLITVATGDMTKEEAKRVGLVPSHAYAVLNVVETSNHLRLLQVKNPWNRKRWRGPYGIDDTERWTPALREELGFDLDYARQAKDDGLFWIDFPSIQRHFSALFLNWNPELFRYRFTLHKHWPLEVGPQNDTYNLGYNPQFKLTFPNAQRPVPPETTQQFLTLHVYKQDQRVYYPNDAFSRGTYSNNPHTLTCLDIALQENESPSFILVASQYEKFSSLDYTLSVFSTDEPFELTNAPDPPPHRINLVDEWSASTAGGCPRYSTFLTNPQYQLVVQEQISVILLTLEAPISFPINLRLMRDGQRVDSVSKKRLIALSGQYRPGFCYIECKDLPVGEYTIIPSTFEPDCVGKFSLQLAASSASYQVYALPPEGYGMIESKCSGKWNSSSGTAVGCSNYGQYLLNPQYLLHVPCCRTFFRLRPFGYSGSAPSVNISLYRCTPTGQITDPNVNPTTAFITSSKGFYTNGACGVRTPLAHIPPGDYVATWQSHRQGCDENKTPLLCSLIVAEQRDLLVKLKIDGTTASMSTLKCFAPLWHDHLADIVIKIRLHL